MKKNYFAIVFVLTTSLVQAQPARDTLINYSQFEFAYPFWSPDGKEIVFQSNFNGNWQLFKRNIATNKIEQLTQNNANDVTPAWSPDGSKILFSSDRDGDDEIFVLHLKTKKVKQLTHNKGRDIHPNWSPDGKTIVFNSDSTNAPGKLLLQIMDENGQNLKTIKKDADEISYASFSPNGKKIVFLRWMDRGKNGEIYCMNADGSGEERLTNNKVWDAWPTWASNDNEVIYSSEIDGAFKLCSVNVNTKVIRQITFGSEEDARANCSKDGKKIIFNRGGSGKIDIVMMYFHTQS